MENIFRITIKAARVNAGKTILEAAKELGIGKDKLINWEKNPGLVPGMFMEKISQTYNIPLDNLIFFDNN